MRDVFNHARMPGRYKGHVLFPRLPNCCPAPAVCWSTLTGLAPAFLQSAQTDCQGPKDAAAAAADRCPMTSWPPQVEGRQEYAGPYATGMPPNLACSVGAKSEYLCFLKGLLGEGEGEEARGRHKGCGSPAGNCQVRPDPEGFLYGRGKA